MFDPTDLAEDLTPAACLKALGQVRGGAGRGGVRRHCSRHGPAHWACGPGSHRRGPRRKQRPRLYRGTHAPPLPLATPAEQGAHLKALLMALRLSDPRLVRHVVLRWVP